MELLISVFIVGVILYFLTRIGLFLLRPVFLSKLLDEIEQLYKKTQNMLAKHSEEAIENLNKWHANDKIIRIHSSQESLEHRIQDAQTAERHNREIHEKFLRIRERFIHNPSKLADAIVIYKRYLEGKLLQNQSAHAHSLQLTSGALNIDEFQSSARETMIILDEMEKKIDILLNDSGGR